MYAGACGMQGAARCELQSAGPRPLAVLTGGGAATGGSPLLSATRQLWAVAAEPGSAWKHWRRTRYPAVAAATGWQRSPAGTARRRAAAAAEPAPVVEMSSSAGGSSGGVETSAPTATSVSAADALASWQQQLARAGSIGEAATAAAHASVVLDGTVQKITFRAADTGYTVMRVQVSAPRKGSQPGSPRTGGSSSSSEGSSQEGASSGGEELDERAAAAAAQLPAALGKKRVITVVGTLPQVGGVDAMVVCGTGGRRSCPGARSQASGWGASRWACWRSCGHGMPCAVGPRPLPRGP